MKGGGAGGSGAEVDVGFTHEGEEEGKGIEVERGFGTKREETNQWRALLLPDLSLARALELLRLPPPELCYRHEHARHST